MKYRPLAMTLMAAGCAALLFTSGCTPRVATRGNLPDPEQLANLKPGEYSKREVMETLGSPSNIATFSDDVWYYVSQRTETEAFFRPEVKERQVVILRFNKKGILEDIQTKGLEDGRQVQPVERETPTAGNEITILQQLFGNFGKFNKEQ